MKRSFLVSLITYLFFISMDVNAQTKKTVPCSTPEYQQFDYWIGNWNVYDTNGKLIGSNNVVKMTNACAIQENWDSKVSDSKGTSYNYYNASDNTWNQVWVDNTGFSLTLKGSFHDNQMKLRSELIKNNKGDFHHQITWTKNDDNSVTQVWTLLDSELKELKELFRGNYKKIIK